MSDDDLAYDGLDPVMGEVVDDPFESVRAGTLQHHDNRVYLTSIELYCGPRSRVEARICMIYRHDNREYHHTRVDVFGTEKRAHAHI